MVESIPVKRVIAHIILLLAFPFIFAHSQITNPIKRANFGLDAGLRANHFNGVPDTDDDWFRRAGDNGTGDFVIDTTGAASIVAGYTTNPASRYYSFARGMRYPLLSTVNNRIYYDASYIRDNHNQPDSTSFTGGSKNGMNPNAWTTTISPVLAKNDIMDVMLHVRRDGVNPSDTLWFFGAVSILGTNGDRYFDFELFQTDITYNKITKKFENVGPDAGHTSWAFDANGNTTRLGDIIFTAEYSNAGLTFIEARIWVHKNYLTSVNPLAFDWTGTYDESIENPNFVYAGIRPNDGGAFYQGLQNAAAVWAGSFGTITSAGAVATDFNPIQFMEFSVNLTKLGLDPMNFTSGSMCNLAFGKVLVKTRTSSSFTASITDFVSPFTFSVQADVDAAANFPILCPTQFIANLSVINPLQTSNYFWTTTDGTFVNSLTDTIVGTQIQISGPGTYIVHQEMLAGCGVSARDTLVVIMNAEYCTVLEAKINDLNAVLQGSKVQLSFTISGNTAVKQLWIERSEDAMHYFPVASLPPQSTERQVANYFYADQWNHPQTLTMYYRIRVTENNGQQRFSNVVTVRKPKINPFSFTLQPNPLVRSPLLVRIDADENTQVELRVIHLNGQRLYHQQHMLKKGINEFRLFEAANWPAGSVVVQVRMGQYLESKQIMVQQ